MSISTSTLAHSDHARRQPGLGLLILSEALVAIVLAKAQTVPASVDAIFGPGERVENGHLTGPIWPERVAVTETGAQPVGIGNVTSPPASRSHWHHHGQTLLILDGVGYH